MQLDTINLVLALVAILEIPVYIALTSLLGVRKQRADADRRLETRLRELEDWRNEHVGEHKGYDRGVAHSAVRPLLLDDVWRDPREVNEQSGDASTQSQS